MIHDIECHIHCRCETRGRARRFWPDSTDFIDLHVLRASWLDGDGPEREIVPVYVRCPRVEEHDDYGNCPLNCAEGEVIDREATLRRLAEGDAKK